MDLQLSLHSSASELYFSNTDGSAELQVNNILTMTNVVMFTKMDTDALLDYCSSSMQNQYFGLGSDRVKAHLSTLGKEPAI